MNDFMFYKEYENRALELQQAAAQQRLARLAKKQNRNTFWANLVKKFSMREQISKRQNDF